MRNMPQELADHVLDYHHADVKTLQSASLVCRSWSLSCRVHLFNKLDLCIFDARTVTRQFQHDDLDHSCDIALRKFERLDAILYEDPTISRFVHEVEVDGSFEQSKSLRALVEGALARILTKVAAMTIRIRHLSWGQLSSPFRHSLIFACCSSSVSELEIWNCQIPTSALVHLWGSPYGLKRLKISHLRKATEDVDDMPITPIIPPTSEDNHFVTTLHHLETLVIETSLMGLILRLLVEANYTIDLQTLRHLQISHVDDISSVSLFIRVAGHHIETLEMWGPSSPDVLCGVHESIDLRYTPRLQNLRLLGVLWSPTSSPADCLNAMFDNIQETYRMSHLYILLSVVKKPRQKLNWNGWRSIDRTLTRSYFSALQHVEVVIHLSSAGPKALNLGKLANHFPELSKRGILSLRCQ
ncbi:hypothetical protein BDQ12DRAFT_737315 [Crucibulum laeve]|uniref:F-box domain-containing protein n=1 Tax=Crucibulum laeve TaxID=68775 RepID=A0A5C3LRU5_9AGAR|nr:hypothetical protein BDQ12DRAFT_737315 [Crucibulum laeve]